MAHRSGSDEALKAWLQVPQAIEKAIKGLSEEDLDLRGGSEGWSIRETVHHLVEANLVASNIVIAALASSGCTYDWSWVNPNRSWMERAGYDRAPVGPALETLAALCRHLSGLIGATAGAPARTVKLLDAPGSKTHTMTVKEVIQQEAEHAQEHLGDVAKTRRQHAR